MSCWREYTCDVLKNVNKQYVLEALKEMGLSVDESVKEVESRWGEGKSAVDGVFIKAGEKLDLGIIFNDETGHVHINGDFWGTGIDDLAFTGTLSQIYAKINRLAQLRLQGWTVDTVTTSTTGEIEIEAYCYA